LEKEKMNEKGVLRRKGSVCGVEWTHHQTEYGSR